MSPDDQEAAPAPAPALAPARSRKQPSLSGQDYLLYSAPARKLRSSVLSKGMQKVVCSQAIRLTADSSRYHGS